MVIFNPSMIFAFKLSAKGAIFGGGKEDFYTCIIQ